MLNEWRQPEYYVNAGCSISLVSFHNACLPSRLTAALVTVHVIVDRHNWQPIDFNELR